MASDLQRGQVNKNLDQAVDRDEVKAELVQYKRGLQTKLETMKLSSSQLAVNAYKSESV